MPTSSPAHVFPLPTSSPAHVVPSLPTSFNARVQLLRPPPSPIGRFLTTLLPELDAVFLGYPRGTITEVRSARTRGPEHHRVF